MQIGVYRWQADGGYVTFGSNWGSLSAGLEACEYRKPFNVMAPRICGSSSGCQLGHQEADSIWKCHLTSIGNPAVEIRRSYDRLISTMGFPILLGWHLHIESSHWRRPALKWIKLAQNTRCNMASFSHTDLINNHIWKYKGYAHIIFEPIGFI